MLLYKEKARREANNPAREFVPNGKQEELIDLVASGTSFVSLFCAANGVGKSACGVNILANIIYGPQNAYFDKGVFKAWPYIKRARIISDPATIKSKIIPEIEKWFPVNEVSAMPEANYETGKEGKNYICNIVTNTGWTIDIMSSEQATKEFESADIGLVLIDEPIPKDKFMATIARGRMGMLIVWTFTPLTYSAWIKEWMDAHTAEGYAAVVEAEMEDNCLIHGTRGVLEHANIERIAQAYPDDEKEARVFGKFGHLIGRVHKDFRRKIHVIKPFPLDHKKYTTYVALDPHARTPDHVLYMSVDSMGRKYLTGEIVHTGQVRELHERMKAYEEVMKYRIEARLIDPSAFNDDQHKEQPSIGSMLFDLGENWTKGSKDLMAGIKRTNDALCYQEVNGKIVMLPELFVFDTLAVTIKQLEEYVWQEWKGSGKDDKKLNARPRDKDDHQVENLHRLLLFEPTFVAYIPERANMTGQSYIEEEKSLDPYS